MENVSNPVSSLDVLISKFINMRNKISDRRKILKMQSLIKELSEIRDALKYPVRFDFWIAVEKIISEAESRDPELTEVNLIIPLRISEKSNPLFINLTNKI